MHTKSGLTLEYGNTTDSQVVPSDGSGVVEVWALDKVSDQASNYMTISYFNIGYVLYPNQIRYAGNTVAGTSPTNSVNFGWQSRTDAPILYAAGSFHQTQYRLATIQTYVGSALVSDYGFAYQYGPSTQRSVLTSITKNDGSSPQNSLPPLTFTYSDAQIDTAPDLVTSIANGFGASTAIAYLPDTSPTVAVIGGGGYFPLTASYPVASTAQPESVVREVQYTVPVTQYISKGALGDVNQNYAIQYFYANPTDNLAGRGSLGFAAFVARDLQTGLQHTAYFVNIFPWIGELSSGGLQIWGTDDLPDWFTDTYGYAESAQGTVFPYVSQTVETRNEISPGSSFNLPQIGAALPTITKTFTYDSAGPGGTTWGNLTKVVDTTSDGYSTTTANTFQAANTTNWLIGLKSNISITAKGIQGTTQTRTSSFAYNSLGQMTSQVIQPGGAGNITSTTAYSYDDFGNINKQTVSGSDVASATTEVTYDPQGQFPVSVKNAINQGESIITDPRFGVVTQLTSINNQTTTFVYDTFGRQIKETNPDGSYENRLYSTCVASNCVSRASVLDQKLASDGTTEVSPLEQINYDAIGRTVYDDKQAFSGTFSQTVYLFDQNGNLGLQTNPYRPGSTESLLAYTYDELGRVLTTTHPDGSTDTTTYYGTGIYCGGELVASTNGLGQAAQICKDGHDNVSYVHDSLGNTLRFTYDGFDQRTAVTDPAGNITTYNFDIRGRAISGTDPDKGAWTASYNSLGELVGTTDAKGQSTSMTYDLLGRMTKRVEPDMTGKWTYDTTNGVGELATESASGVASPSGQAGVTGYTKTYTYDSLGRLDEVLFTGPASGPEWVNATYPENFAYDSASRQVEFSTNWDNITTNYNGYGYENGEVQTSTGSPLWTATTEDPWGSLTSASYGAGPAITENFTYDPQTERMTGISATGPGSKVLGSISYVYDVLGNVLQRTTTAAAANNGQPLSEYYSYDGLNRLCTVNPGSSNLATIATSTQPCQSQPASLTSVGTSMTYDALGDMLAKLGDGGVGTYAYPAARQPQPHAVQSIVNSSVNTNGGLSSSFTYDADGNMTSGAGRTITYTSFNMVKSVTLGTNTVAFSYDADHNRLTQVNPQIATLYLPNVEITATSGGTSNEVHTYFNDLNGQHVGELDRTGVTVASVGTAVVKFYINDWQNSVAIITNGAGGLLEGDSYDAWGKRRALTGAPDTNDSITSQTIHGYTNQEEVQDVQLIDLNARMYDPYLGVMLGVDPAVANWLDPQSWNAYAYARDNPMRYTDPTGMWNVGDGGVNYDVDPAGDPGNGLAGVMGAAASLGKSFDTSQNIAAVWTLENGGTWTDSTSGYTYAEEADGTLDNVTSWEANGDGSSLSGSGGNDGTVQLGGDTSGDTQVAGPYGGEGLYGSNTASDFNFNDLAKGAAVVAVEGCMFTGACEGAGAVVLSLGSAGLLAYDLFGSSVAAEEAGTATISQYATDAGAHFSIEVNAGGQSLSTEQIITNEFNDTTIGINTSVNPVNSVTVQLPNGQGALDYMNGLLGENTGTYNSFSNSCLSYCGNVLNAGGLNVPLNNTLGTARFLNSLGP